MVIVGIISQVSTEVPLLVREDGYHAVASVDLMGEIISGDVTGDAHFFAALRAIRRSEILRLRWECSNCEDL